MHLEPLKHGKRSFAKDGIIGPAQWTHHDLIIVCNGAIDIQMGEHTFSCPTNSACLIPPRCPFNGRVLQNGTVLWVQHFSLKRQSSKHQRLELPTQPTVWPNSMRAEWPRSLMKSIEEDYDAGLSEERSFDLSCKLHLLLSVLCRHPNNDKLLGKRNHSIMLKTLDWLEDHPWPLPCIADICAQAGWSESYFRLLFKRYNGQSIGEYLRTLRHAEARRLLRETQYPIKEISFRTGYSDTVSFSRAFTKEHGLSPGKYRNDSTLV